MNIKQRFNQSPFLRNFSFLTIGQIFARAINMITQVILARWLSPEGYGEYSLILTYIAIFGVVAALGMNYIINRCVARDQDNSKKYLHICMRMRFVGFFIAVVSFIIYNSFREIPIVNNVLLSILFGVFLESVWAGLTSISFGMQRMEWNSLLEVLIAFITAILYLVLQTINTNYITVTSVVFIYLILLLLKNIIFYNVLLRQNLIRGEFSFTSISNKDSWDVLKQGFPFYILAMVGLFTNQFPVLFLEEHTNITEVAYFNTANKLLLPVTILLSTALTALFPNQSKLFVENKEKYWIQVKKMFLYIISCGGILALAISLFRNEIVLLLFGPKYASTGNVMAYQIWYTILFALFSLNGNALGASDRQKLLSFESVVFALITTPIIYYFSYNGAEGLSIGYCLAGVFNLLFLYSMLIRVSEHRITMTFVGGMLFLLIIPVSVSFVVPTSVGFVFKLLCIAIVVLVNFYIYKFLGYKK